MNVKQKAKTVVKNVICIALSLILLFSANSSAVATNFATTNNIAIINEQSCLSLTMTYSEWLEHPDHPQNWVTNATTNIPREEWDLSLWYDDPVWLEHNASSPHIPWGGYCFQ